MNKMQLLILNVLLLTTAGLATVGLLGSRGEPPALPLYEPRSGEASVQPSQVQDAGPASSLDVQVVWEKNLMHPARSSAVDEAVATAVAVDNRPADLELVGIGKIGSREAAVILVHAPAVRRLPRGFRPPGQPEEPTAGAKRRIYNVGDAIEDTGYRLQEIHFDKQAGLREVVLVDENGASRTLKIETDDHASQSRATSAAESAAAIERAAAASAPPVAPPVVAARGDGVGTTPPPPPPAPEGAANQPPPTPAAMGDTFGVGGDATVPDKPVAEMTREERLRWAIEMRRRQMQNNPGSSTGQPGQPGQPNRP